MAPGFFVPSCQGMAQAWRRPGFPVTRLLLKCQQRMSGFGPQANDALSFTAGLTHDLRKGHGLASGEGSPDASRQNRA